MKGIGRITVGNAVFAKYELLLGYICEVSAAAIDTNESSYWRSLGCI